MISILKEIDITQVFNNFVQKKCFNHKKRMASSVCLHEDCWKSDCDQAFFCVDCIVSHERKHGISVRCNALFTDELFEELDEYRKNLNTKDKLKERIRKFDGKINELNIKIEQWTRCQFSELKKFFENFLMENLQNEYFETINNLKEMLSEAPIDLKLNYELKEKVNSSYCTQIKRIQNEFNDIMNWI